MRKNKLQLQSGLIRQIILIVGALVLLKYIYDLDVVGYLTEGRFKELWDKFYILASKGWEKYGDLAGQGWDWAKEIIKNIISKIKK